MTAFTFTKANPFDPRDIGFEIEDTSRALAAIYDCCRAEVIDYSGDDSPRPWVRVELRSSSGDDCEEAGNWYFAELWQRGIVMMRG